MKKKTALTASRPSSVNRIDGEQPNCGPHLEKEKKSSIYRTSPPERKTAYPITIIDRSFISQRQQKRAKSKNPPSRHLGPHLHPPKLDTPTKPRRQPRTLHRINNAPGRGVARGTTRVRVPVHVKHPLPLGVRYKPIIRRCEIECAPGSVVDGRGRSKDGGIADVVCGEGGNDVEVAVLEEGVVLRGGGHFELAVSV